MNFEKDSLAGIPNIKDSNKFYMYTALKTSLYIFTKKRIGQCLSKNKATP